MRKVVNRGSADRGSLKYILGLALLVALAVSSLSFAARPYNTCQRSCNDQYRVAVHACGKDTACQQCVYAAWHDCFYLATCTVNTSGCVFP